MRRFLFAFIFFAVGVLICPLAYSQLGPGSTAGTSLGAGGNSEKALEARQRALQLQQQISQINNSYNEQANSTQSQLAQAKMQLAQCESGYSEGKTQAEQQYKNDTNSALQGLLGNMMGPASQMLSNMASGELKKDEQRLESARSEYESKRNAIRDMGINQVSSADYNPPIDADDTNKTPNFGALKQRCRQAVSPFDTADPHSTTPGQQTAVPGAGAPLTPSAECYIAVGELESKYSQAVNAAQRVKEGKAQNTSSLLTTGLIAGAGYWGYSTAKKNAGDAKDAAIDAAADGRDACVMGANQNIADLNRQLASLDKKRNEEIKFAREAAKLAEDYAGLNNINGPNPNLPINPDSIADNNTSLINGGKINDPTLPTNDNANNSGAPQTTAAESPSIGGGGGGGGGAPPDSSGSWTFGSPYPSNTGGGGLAVQPGEAKYVSDSGGGGFFGFGSAEEAFDSFGAYSDNFGDNASGGGNPDDGLPLMLRRARQVLSAHAAELLTQNNYPTLARKSPQPNIDTINRKAASVRY